MYVQEIASRRDFSTALELRNLTTIPCFQWIIGKTKIVKKNSISGILTRNFACESVTLRITLNSDNERYFYRFYLQTNNIDRVYNEDHIIIRKPSDS